MNTGDSVARSGMHVLMASGAESLSAWAWPQAAPPARFLLGAPPSPGRARGEQPQPVVLLERPRSPRRGELGVPLTSSVPGSSVAGFAPWDSHLDSVFQTQVNHSECLT